MRWELNLTCRDCGAVVTYADERPPWQGAVTSGTYLVRLAKGEPRCRSGDWISAWKGRSLRSVLVAGTSAWCFQLTA